MLQHYATELDHIRNSYAGLTVSKRGELEDLLMEGDLLEVTMDEVQQLWLLLQEDSECRAAFEKAEEACMDHNDSSMVRWSLPCLHILGMHWFASLDCSVP